TRLQIDRRRASARATRRASCSLQDDDRGRYPRVMRDRNERPYHAEALRRRGGAPLKNHLRRSGGTSAHLEVVPQRSCFAREGFDRRFFGCPATRQRGGAIAPLLERR